MPTTVTGASGQVTGTVGAGINTITIFTTSATTNQVAYITWTGILQHSTNTSAWGHTDGPPSAGAGSTVCAGGGKIKAGPNTAIKVLANTSGTSTNYVIEYQVMYVSDQ